MGIAPATPMFVGAGSPGPHITRNVSEKSPGRETRPLQNDRHGTLLIRRKFSPSGGDSGAVRPRRITAGGSPVVGARSPGPHITQNVLEKSPGRETRPLQNDRHGTLLIRRKFSPSGGDSGAVRPRRITAGGSPVVGARSPGPHITQNVLEKSPGRETRPLQPLSENLL